MHPEIKQNKPGKCPKCGMSLVPESELDQGSEHHNPEESYWPLVVIFGMISVSVGVLGIESYIAGSFSWQVIFMNFMAGFFLVFGAFKIFDLKGFAEGYAQYDLLAKRVHGYGYVYPFVEIVLGLAFLLHINNPMLHVFTFLLMGFSGIGVAIKMLKREKFQCACLGTFLKVPLTTVTLVEDFGMAGMAILMMVL